MRRFAISLPTETSQLPHPILPPGLQDTRYVSFQVVNEGAQLILRTLETRNAPLMRKYTE